MIKNFCFFLLLPALVNAQSLTLSIENTSIGNRYSTFQLEQHNVTFSGNSISFSGSGVQFNDYLAYGVSPDFSTIGVLQNAAEGANVFLLDTAGDTLSSYDIFSSGDDDPSLAVYPLNRGSVLIRDNIANFTLYTPDGKITTSGSGSSGSEKGESISEAAMDVNAKTILIYTPKIKKGEDAFGSQAQILRKNNATDVIYYSSDREIKYGGVSGDGQFMILITAKEGTDDQVIIEDRFGNELDTISSDEDLDMACFSGDSNYLLLYSGSRALVYSTIEGERIGSTSFRSPLVKAQYFPADHTIVGVTGNYAGDTGILKDIEFHAINLQQRQIARKELNEALGTSPYIPLEFQREATGKYRLMGASKIINLRASF